MHTSEKFCLKWNDFQQNINTAFEGLRKEIKKRTSLNDEFRVMYVRQASLEMEDPKKDKEQNNLLVFHVERGHWPPTKFSIDTGDNYDLSFDDGKI